MTRLFIAVMLVALPACTQVPVYKKIEMAHCVVDKSLVEPCQGVVPLVEGDTYDQLIGKDVLIRGRLRECSAKHAALAEGLASCNEAIQRFNKSN